MRSILHMCWQPSRQPRAHLCQGRQPALDPVAHGHALRQLHGLALAAEDGGDRAAVWRELDLGREGATRNQLGHSSVS